MGTENSIFIFDREGVLLSSFCVEGGVRSLSIAQNETLLVVLKCGKVVLYSIWTKTLLISNFSKLETVECGALDPSFSKSKRCILAVGGQLMLLKDSWWANTSFWNQLIFNNNLRILNVEWVHSLICWNLKDKVGFYDVEKKSIVGILPCSHDVDSQFQCYFSFLTNEIVCIGWGKELKTVKIKVFHWINFRMDL